jgi:hypothetical protein
MPKSEMHIFSNFVDILKKLGDLAFDIFAQRPKTKVQKFQKLYRGQCYDFLFSAKALVFFFKTNAMVQYLQNANFSS